MGSRERKKYRTEFHVHTRFSHDSFLGRCALLMMCKIRRIDAVAITDHNEIEGALALKSYLENNGVSVIVGEEIFTSEGEIIGLFLKDRVEPGLTPEDTVAEIKRQNGIVYVPHPYDEKRHKTVLSHAAFERCSNWVDCAEIHNGRNVDLRFSAVQKRICEEMGVLPIVGGDAHCFFEIGRNICITQVPFDRGSFHCVLKNATFQTRKCLFLSHKATAAVRLWGIFKEEGIGGVCRAVFGRLRKRIWQAGGDGGE